MRLYMIQKYFFLYLLKVDKMLILSTFATRTSYINHSKNARKILSLFNNVY